MVSMQMSDSQCKLPEVVSEMGQTIFYYHKFCQLHTTTCSSHSSLPVQTLTGISMQTAGGVRLWYERVCWGLTLLGWGCLLEKQRLFGVKLSWYLTVVGKPGLK